MLVDCGRGELSQAPESTTLDMRGLGEATRSACSQYDTGATASSFLADLSVRERLQSSCSLLCIA